MSTAGSPFRSKTITRVPSALKRSTTAAPMPAAPPVTIAVLPFSPRISSLLGNHGGRLELDLAGRMEQVGREDYAHHRIVAFYQLAPDAADLGASGEIGRLVAAVGGHAADVLGARASLRQDGEDVLQCLAELRRDVLGLEHLLRVPSDLASDEDDAARGLDAIGIADRRFPAARKEHLHSFVLGGSGSWSQPGFGCGTFFIHSRIRRTCSTSSAAISRAAARTCFGARLAAIS